jgi:hypothetical protein
MPTAPFLFGAFGDEDSLDVRQSRMVAGALHVTGPAYVGIRQHTPAYASIRQHTSAYVSIRQHTSAYVSIRQHTSAYVSSIREALHITRLKSVGNVLEASLSSVRENGFAGVAGVGRVGCEIDAGDVGGGGPSPVAFRGWEGGRCCR